MSAETQTFKVNARVLGPIYAQITPETFNDTKVVMLLVEAKGHDGQRHSVLETLDEDWLYSNFDRIWERMGILLKDKMQQYYAQSESLKVSFLNE